jgi:hypothetical protein
MTTSTITRAGGVAAAMAVALVLAACGEGDQAPPDPAGSPTSTSTAALPIGSEPAQLDPAEFSEEITNPYWPMAPGDRWVYREADPEGDKRVVVTVMDRTRRVANGVEARVVHDVVTQNGAPIEVTDDWYAQDAEGNVWYLGEATAEYEDGKVVSREGSFEAGAGGAEAGVIMPADPQPGLAYRQEHLAGEAEDRAEVLGIATRVTVAAGVFEEVLQTEDVNPLGDPVQVENKFFARGVGPVLTLDLTGEGREELVRHLTGGTQPSG